MNDILPQDSVKWSYLEDTVRRVLNMNPGIDAILLMVLLAFAIRGIIAVLLPAEAFGAEPRSLGTYVGGLISTYIGFAIEVTLICYIGRIFGGKADMRQTAVAMAWYHVVTSVIEEPVALIARMNIQAMMDLAKNPEAAPPPGGLAFLGFAAGCLLIWLFAAFIAELHGFKRTMSVLAAMVAMMLLPALLLMSSAGSV